MTEHNFRYPTLLAALHFAASAVFLSLSGYKGELPEKDATPESRIIPIEIKTRALSPN